MAGVDKYVRPRTMARNAHMPRPPRSVDKYGVRSRWLAMLIYLGIGAILPSLYIWLLPVLSEAQAIPLLRGYDAEFPAYRHQISYYIATAPGTGVMAAVFLQPLMLMGSDEAARLNIHTASPAVKRAYYGTLTGFKLGFGLFLWLTVTEYSWPHMFAVGFFCFCVLGHALITLHAGRMPLAETAIFIVGALSTSALIACIVVVGAGRELPDYLFWGLECVALTAMVFFSPVYILWGERYRHEALPGLLLSKYRAVFDACADADGKMDLQVYRAMVRAAGVDASDPELYRTRWGERGPDGKVSFAEFCDLQQKLVVARSIRFIEETRQGRRSSLVLTA
jgi:hypothetical protein